MSGKSSRLPWLIEAVKSHNSDECLIWPYPTTKAGYGEVNFEGERVTVHRLAFRLAFGRWPEPMGRHSCDSRVCINPRHIVEGSVKENLVAAVAARTHIPWFLNAVKSHDSDECLLWPHSKDDKGYGRFYFEGRITIVHRAAFKVVHGHWPIPEGCHSCDTPACFNPRHIFEGTHRDNMSDSAAKLRTAAGERHWDAKLTAELVRQIRAEYISHDPHHDHVALAHKYGVSRRNIGMIIKRQTWKHV